MLTILLVGDTFFCLRINWKKESINACVRSEKEGIKPRDLEASEDNVALETITNEESSTSKLLPKTTTENPSFEETTYTFVDDPITN